MYTININYETGNSYGTHTEEDQISLVWKDKEKAQAALLYIKEHYNYYKSLKSYGLTPEERNKIKEAAKTKTWYISVEPEFVLNLELDDGTYKQINAFWCGYFEKPNYAEVILCNDEEDKDKIYFF